MYNITKPCNTTTFPGNIQAVVKHTDKLQWRESLKVYHWSLTVWDYFICILKGTKMDVQDIVQKFDWFGMAVRCSN